MSNTSKFNYNQYIESDLVVDLSPFYPIEISSPTPSRTSIHDLVGRAKNNFFTFQGSIRKGMYIL